MFFKRQELTCQPRVATSASSSHLNTWTHRVSRTRRSIIQRTRNKLLIPARQAAAAVSNWSKHRRMLLDQWEGLGPRAPDQSAPLSSSTSGCGLRSSGPCIPPVHYSTSWPRMNSTFAPKLRRSWLGHCVTVRSRNCVKKKKKNLVYLFDLFRF